MKATGTELKHHLLILFVLALQSNVLIVDGEVLSTYGSDFYIGFLRQYSPTGTIQIRVHTFETTTISFSITSKTGYSYIGTTSASSPTTVTIPTSFQVRDSGYDYRNFGLHITSLPTKSITVLVIGYTTVNNPRMTHLAHPYLEQLTSAYIYYGVSTYIFSQVLLVGCRDNTTVTITPTQNISIPENLQLSESIYLNISAGDSHTVTIHEMQSLLISSFDLSGTKIVSNHPLTVVGGHECAQIPYQFGNCDPISTQIPPTVNWGKHFLLPPLTSRTNGQRYRIIASERNTIAEIKCGTNLTEIALLPNEGDILQFDTNFNEFCTVLTSNPSYVAEYGFGRDYLSDGFGDPLLMTIPPLDQYVHSVTFSSFDTVLFNYYSILVPNDQYFNQTYLYNGFTVTPTWIAIYYPNGSIAGYGYSTAFIGTVTISHSNPNGNILVTVYGFVFAGAYGYTAGMKLNPLNIDVDLPEISFTTEKYYVGEGDGVAVIVLERHVEVTQSVSVRIKILSSLVATAKEGADYISINEIVNFQSGETVKNVSITILDDSYVEGTEYFILKIESMEGDVITFSVSEAVVAIQDDDVLKIGFTRNSSVVTSDGETSFKIGILSGKVQFGVSVRVMLTAIGPTEDEVNICIVEFNYYAENYTIETNFSHIISAESHTEAASWIVQLSSDSPDVNIILDPNQVSMNTQTSAYLPTSTSKTETSTKILTSSFSELKSSSSSCEHSTEQLALYIGAGVFALFLITLTIICTVAICFCCLYHKHKVLQVDTNSFPMHPNTYTNESSSDIHRYHKDSLPSLPDDEIYSKVEDEYENMEVFK